MRGVHAIAVRLERLPRRVERVRRPAQIARGERDLGLGDDASRTGHRLLRAERPGRAPHERLRPHQIAELCQRDAAQRQRRRVVAQGDPLQRAEGITGGERARRGRDQRVHRNPATLVTPTVRRPPLNLSHGGGRTRRREHVDGEANPQGERTMATQMTGTPTHMTGTRDEWLAARLELLDAEKDLTRRADELARRRQELPWVADRQAVSIRDRRGERLAGGSLPRTLAAPRLSLHVRARLQGGLPVLLGNRGRVQRVRRPPREPRRHADGGVAGAAREAAGVQAPDGVDVPVGVLVSAATSTATSASRSPRRSSAKASSTTTGARSRRRPPGKAASRGRSSTSRP